VDHLLGLRLRLVPEAAWHPWAEQPRELLLIAGDDEAWLALVALSNLAHLSNADFRGPRVDWRDLEQHCRGELICLTGAPMVGVLSPLVEHAADPSNPTEAMPLTRRLAELFPPVHRAGLPPPPARKLINRGLVALAQRLDLPLVYQRRAFARKQDALTSACWRHRSPPARRGGHWPR
jgi:DNA polymerase III alpha subunit